MSAEKPYLHLTHIGEESPEYKESIERAREWAPEYPVIYGENEIENIDKIKKKIEILEKHLSDINIDEKSQRVFIDAKIRFEKLVTEQIFALKSHLLKSYGNNYSIYKNFFEELGEDESVINMFADLLKKMKGEVDNGVKILILLREGLISDEQFLYMLSRHVELWSRKREQFNKQVPDMFADFRDTVLQAINDGDLPISEVRADSRIQETYVDITDGIRQTKEIGGSYIPELHMVTVLYDSDRNEMKKSLFHELVHALSGRTMVLKKDHEPLADVETQRQGLSFSVYDRDGRIVENRFEWIDEAVTESISSHLLGINGADELSYKREIEMLEKLYQSGISKKSVYEAYFEDYDPTDPELVPKWKKLIRDVGNASVVSGVTGGVRVLSHVEELNKLRQEINSLFEGI